MSYLWQVIITEVKPSYQELSEKYFQSQNDYKELEGKYFVLQQQLAQLQRMIWGSRSERFAPVADPSQTALALNAESSAEVEEKKQEITYTRTTVTKKPNHKGRIPLPKHLPRVVITLEPQENIEGLKAIGKEITEELDYTPGKFFVNRYERTKYARVDGSGIVAAPLPSRPIEKGIPGAGLLTQILIDKYADHLPLHRQLQRFKREDIHIAPSTITDWVKHSCNLIAPLYEVLKQKIISSSYLMADESPIKVLDRDKEGATHQGYYWVYRSPLENLVLFDYHPGRGRDGPAAMLQYFKGHLQTDGYGVYDEFDKRPGITLMHCMAHARRYFEQALDNDQARAQHALSQIQLLYKTERTARENNYDHAQRLELRQQQSIAVLNDLGAWLKDNITQTLPKSSIGKAIAYSLARWDKLCLYAHHGHLEIDNNPVENAIRPMVIGRKNYLFAGSHDAAQRAAIIYSLLGCCKIKNVNPYTWLRDTLSKINDHKADKLDELLPV